MIGVIIIICALIWAFLDKPGLFKRPTDKGKFAAIVVLLISAIASTIKEVEDNTRQDHDSAKIDSLSNENRTLLKRSQNLQTSIDSVGAKWLLWTAS